MGLLGIFSRKSKPNLTPDVQMPSQEDLAFTPQMRNLVKRRVFEGQDLGFGEDFVSKATNPAIKDSERRFQQQTVPFLSSQLSARGVARSGGAGLATDVLGKAQQEQQSQVDQMVAEFYHLNELQRKQDFGQALQLGENMQSQQAQLLGNRAAASERLNQRTQEQSRYNDQIDQQRFSTAAQALGALVGTAAGGAGGFGAGGAGGAGGQVASAMGSPVFAGQTIQGASGGMNGLSGMTGGIGKILSSLGSNQQSSLNIAGSSYDRNKLLQLLANWDSI